MSIIGAQSSEGLLPVVQQDLCPANQAKSHKDLGLHLDRDVEVLDNRVYPEWYAGWSTVSRFPLFASSPYSHNAHRNIIMPGSPSVFFVRQLVHI